MRQLGLLLLVVCSPAHAEDLLDRIQQELEATRTATLTVSSWQTDGERIEASTWHQIWAGPDHLRVDMVEGTGKGSSAVLNGDSVLAWKRGLLGWLRVTLDRQSPRALSLRGRDLGNAGYFDEWIDLLAQRDSAVVETDDGGWVVRYRDFRGLETILWMADEPLRVLRHEVLEDGVVVERARYTNVVLNPSIDPSQLERTPSPGLD